ncbi:MULTISPECIES: signal peptidase II [Bacillus]|uniref:signal peptidase II n=1 Tax=Bacillus TaxID=1386 RepID=UPI001F58FF2F|nr:MULTISPECIES: signal peptidase II [Bacillus]MCU5533494.1 signal peptidase II [Bacillus cereus]MDF9475057.1 signal peptidase II [Bacillus cereus]MDF9497088.1 signal peptidase II [Bacillus cereus]MDF9518500.1 signal peptidase II [Bacillus cereus]MDF9568145.1 signal peptidase II [Bacillus cereus]
MVNKARHMKVKLWSVRALIIFFFAISAITLSQGVVHVQSIVKERFFTEKKTEKVYKETINYGDTEDYGTPIEEKKVGDNGERTTTGKKFKDFEKENSWGDVFSVLSNSWISIVFYVMIAGGIIYFLYKSVRKKLTKPEIEQEKKSVTKENTVRTENNKKVIHQLKQPLPTNTIRKTLVEWERTLPFHEQRRSYETMQQWLKRISRTRNITSLYESVRYGEKTYTELDVEKIMKWVEGDGKVDT